MEYFTAALLPQQCSHALRLAAPSKAWLWGSTTSQYFSIVIDIAIFFRHRCWSVRGDVVCPEVGLEQAADGCRRPRWEERWPGTEDGGSSSSSPSDEQEIEPDKRGLGAGMVGAVVRKSRDDILCMRTLSSMNTRCTYTVYSSPIHDVAPSSHSRRGTPRLLVGHRLRKNRCGFAASLSRS
jgi:hypothetical protein